VLGEVKMNRFYNNDVSYVSERHSSSKGDPKFIRRMCLILAILFIISGIALFASQMDDYFTYKKLSDGGYYTYGEITDVNREVVDNHNGESDYYYDIRGTYSVDGKTYDFYFRSNVSEREGDRIKLLYEEGNPSNYIQDDCPNDHLVIGFLSFGVSFILCIYAYKSHVELKKKRR
jgi:hypothetical protein